MGHTSGHSWRFVLSPFKTRRKTMKGDGLFDRRLLWIARKPGRYRDGSRWRSGTLIKGIGKTGMPWWRGLCAAGSHMTRWAWFTSECGTAYSPQNGTIKPSRAGDVSCQGDPCECRLRLACSMSTLRRIRAVPARSLPRLSPLVSPVARHGYAEDRSRDLPRFRDVHGIVKGVGQIFSPRIFWTSVIILSSAWEPKLEENSGSDGEITSINFRAAARFGEPSSPANVWMIASAIASAFCPSAKWLASK